MLSPIRELASRNIESSAKFKNYKEVGPMRGYKKLIKNAREYLKNVEERIETLPYDGEEFYAVMKEFYEFFNELNNLRARNIDELIFPEDIEIILNKLNIQFKIKNFNDDDKIWLEHIQDSVCRLLNLYNTIPENLNGKEKRVIQDSVERHYKHLLENIEYYKNKFKKEIPKELNQEMNDCIHKFQKNQNLYIRTKEDMQLGSLNIKSLDFDQAIDLYEKIKKAKGSKKEELEKELKSMMKILKED